MPLEITFHLARNLVQYKGIQYRTETDIYNGIQFRIQSDATTDAI